MASNTKPGLKLDVGKTLGFAVEQLRKHIYKPIRRKVKNKIKKSEDLSQMAVNHTDGTYDHTVYRHLGRLFGEDHKLSGINAFVDLFNLENLRDTQQELESKDKVFYRDFFQGEDNQKFLDELEKGVSYFKEVEKHLKQLSINEIGSLMSDIEYLKDSIVLYGEIMAALETDMPKEKFSKVAYAFDFKAHKIKLESRKNELEDIMDKFAWIIEDEDNKAVKVRTKIETSGVYSKYAYEAVNRIALKSTSRKAPRGIQNFNALFNDSTMRSITRIVKTGNEDSYRNFFQGGGSKNFPEELRVVITYFEKIKFLSEKLQSKDVETFVQDLTFVEKTIISYQEAMVDMEINATGKLKKTLDRFDFTEYKKEIDKLRDDIVDLRDKNIIIECELEAQEKYIITSAASHENSKPFANLGAGHVVSTQLPPRGNSDRAQLFLAAQARREAESRGNGQSMASGIPQNNIVIEGANAATTTTTTELGQ